MNWDRFDGGWLITFPDGHREWINDAVWLSQFVAFDPAFQSEKVHITEEDYQEFRRVCEVAKKIADNPKAKKLLLEAVAMTVPDA